MAVNDVRNLTAVGYRVATVEDWDNLTTYLGGSSIAGGKLKSTSSTYWDSPNTSATNEVGFNAKGCGYREYDFGSFKQSSWYLTSTTGDYFGCNFKRAFEYNSASVTVPFRQGSPTTGFPVRVVKISTSLPEGGIGSYQGNDGKVYETKCINGIEWCVSELTETKWRNGTYIKGFDGGVYTPIINDDWFTLTEAALCAFADDINNAYVYN